MPAHGLSKKDYLTEADKAIITKMRCNGDDPRDIADQFLVSPERIYQLTLRLGLPARKSTKVPVYTQILELHGQGLSSLEIHRKLKCNHPYVKRIIRRAMN
jgi:DNA-binding CsgD family transcriptional regulator